jgi:Putative GTPase activating protein for Arf
MQPQQRQSQQLLDHVASELESIRILKDAGSSDSTGNQSSTKMLLSHNKHQYNDIGVRFPIACLQLLQSLPGNQHCVDCGAVNPDWASITYGTLLCLQCSGKHRSYGVQISYVRSIRYDTWDHTQILSMLEGGNAQLRTFYDRHQLLNNGDSLYNQRYHTKAALFYKVNLVKHVQSVASIGIYRGREYNRQCIHSNSNSKKYRSISPTTVVDNDVDPDRRLLLSNGVRHGDNGVTRHLSC